MKPKWLLMAAGLLLAGMAFIATPHADAATCTAVAGGGLCTGSPWYQGWADGSTWTGCAGSCPGTGAGCPTASDDVIIPAGSCVRVGVTGAVAGTLSVSGDLYFGNRNNNALGNLDVAGNMTLNAGGTIQPSVNGTSNLYVGGNFTNSGGTFTGISGSQILAVTFDGTGAQTIGGTTSTTFYNLTINNTSADTAGVSLGNSETVNNALTLTDGMLKVAGYDLTIGASGSISGGSVSAMVVTDVDGTQTGRLCKIYNGSLNPALFTYPIGDTRDTTQYSRVTLDWGGTYTYSNLVACARVTNAVHPNKPPLSANWLTRYWTLSIRSGSVTPFSTAVVFYYNDPGDIHGVESDLTYPLAYRSWSGSWSASTAINASTNAFGKTLTSFSDHTAFSNSPTAVTLESMESVADPARGQIDVTWQTAQEVDNQGFNLWRGTSRDDPNLIKLNADIIPSQAPGNGMGAEYAYPDSYQLVAGTTYFYWLEDVSLGGVATRHEPVTVTYTGPTAVSLAGFGATQTAPAALPFAAAGLALVVLTAAGLKRRRDMTTNQPD